MAFRILALAALTAPFVTVDAVCPHEDGIFEKWSDAATWANNQVDQVLSISHQYYLSICLQYIWATLDFHYIFKPCNLYLSSLKVHNDAVPYLSEVLTLVQKCGSVKTVNDSVPEVVYPGPSLCHQQRKADNSLGGKVKSNSR